jgi:hypothetical protein
LSTTTRQHGDAIEREKRIVAVMIGLFCRLRHATRRGALCAECADLLEYAHARLSRCPYGTAKPACRDCPIHCYRPQYRERIRTVMRFSGPRMLVYHPIEWLRHRLGR